METTPNDIRQQQFEIKFRGYNPDDVEVFRDLAANALEEARTEALKLTEENKHLRERLEHLTSIEETLKAAVLEAQKNDETTIDTAKQKAKDTVEQAQKEAELILKEAHQRRDEVVADMHRQMSKLVTDINKIRFIRSNYLSKLKALLQSQMEMVEDAIRDTKDDVAPPEPKMPQTMTAAPHPPMQAEAPPPPPSPEAPEPQQPEAPPEPPSEEPPRDESEQTDVERQEMNYDSQADVSPEEAAALTEDEGSSDEEKPPATEEDEEWKQLKEQLNED